METLSDFLDSVVTSTIAGRGDWLWKNLTLYPQVPACEHTSNYISFIAQVFLTIYHNNAYYMGTYIGSCRHMQKKFKLWFFKHIKANCMFFILKK